METEFESFPQRYDEEEESTTIGKLKRFLFSTAVSTTASVLADSATRPQSPASLTRSASTASAPIPFPKRAQQDSPTAVVPAPPLLNRRPTRLSNVTPSVRLAPITSDGEFNIQSSSQKSVARSIHSHSGGDYGFLDGLGMGRSPTPNHDSFQNLAALSSIPGFPLQEADTRSVRSMSSSAIGSSASPSVAHIFRRLRGEVSFPLFSSIRTLVDSARRIGTVKGVLGQRRNDESLLRLREPLLHLPSETSLSNLWPS